VKDGLGAHAFPWPTEPVTVANRKCVYVPRVVGAQVHQPIRFVNDDPTDHNVHGFTASGQFNFTLRGKDASQVQKLRHPEVVVRVKCDLHPWMIGYVGVVPHPFFAVTGDDGAFELKGLPPGDYVLEAWHEKLGTRTASVKLGAGGTAEATFRFSP
jgi:plastocyanin